MIGSVLTSNNLAYKLQLNANGNLVLCRMTGIPDVIWTSDGNYPELPPSGKRAVNQPGVNKPGFSKGTIILFYHSNIRYKLMSCVDAISQFMTHTYCLLF